MAANSLATLVVIVALCFGSVNAQLTSTFYDKSCPNALSLIKSGIKKALASEKRLGASILRLHFHDCFAQGCDGSILLDGSSGEKTAGPNLHSARGFNVIDNIKSQVEAACSGVVSCADILAVSARDSVVELGGPTWTVPLGRRDSKTSNLNAANTNIPSPASTLGAHTIGKARCTVFRGRIYNDTNIDSAYAKSLQANCPSGKIGNRNLAPLDYVSPTVFDNNYYKNLRKKKGLLHSDQELFNGGSTDSLVTTYSSSQSTFFNDFATAMVNMGNINPLTGSSGEIRKNCRKAN